MPTSHRPDALRRRLAAALRPARPAALALAAVLAAAAAPAQPGGGVYRCPGNVYTDGLDRAEAQARGCIALDIGVALPAPPRRAGAEAAGQAASGAAGPRPAPRPAGAASAAPIAARVDPAEQRARDADKRRILDEELAREEARLATLKRELQAPPPPGQPAPAREAAQRALQASIARSEADLAALRRELAKTSP